MNRGVKEGVKKSTPILTRENRNEPRCASGAERRASFEMQMRGEKLRIPKCVRLLSILLACLALAGGCKRKEQTAAKPPEVEVVSVTQRDVPIFREWVGTTEGNDNASISAEVSGYLMSRDYVEGSVVTNGQLMFQIDPRPFQATLDHAKSDLDQARATQEKWALKVKRYTPLAAKQAISKQELDDAVQNEKAAQAQIEAAKAAVQSAEVNLGFTTIRSPINGVAGLYSPRAQVGNLVDPASGPLSTVTAIDPMRVYASVSQRVVTEIMEKRLAAGKKVDPDQTVPLELILATGSVYPQKGRLRFRNNQVDVKTGTVTVVGEFPNTNALLIPGMFVTIRALFATQTNALLVPQRAVTEMQGKYLISVVGADNKVSTRPVEVGERTGQEWVIKGDVKAGDRVVAEGVQKVHDGTLVSAVPFNEKPAGEPLTPTGEKKP
jgi:membrane fusion protein (multidrug efflux system)